VGPLRFVLRILALALIGAGLVMGWFGVAEMLFEKPSAMFWRMVLPGAALIIAGVAVEEFAWRRPGRFLHRP
jgi:hypothetical protein